MALTGALSKRRAAVQTWLYRIATNACLDEARASPRGRAEPLVEPYPPTALLADRRLAGFRPGPRDTRCARAWRLALLTAIQRLPGTPAGRC